MEKQTQYYTTIPAVSKSKSGGGGGGEHEGREAKTYCVTGATGYIGSWLVKSLLQRGCCVHATVRHPAKCSHLLTLWDGGDRLKLFEADLHQEGSFDAAVKDCHGVFHVAASMEFTVPPMGNLDNYVQSNILDPSIKGTLNLLKSCLKSKSVKRVVFTSSISTMTAKDSRGEWLPTVDESCQTPIDIVWSRKTGGWVYVLSKRLSEEVAFRFANENGDSELFPILSAVNSRMGSIALVHIEDISSAHIYLMEHDRAKGRYICCTESCSMSELVHCLAKEYPSPNLQGVVEAEKGSIPTKISSKKLKDLGFMYKYRLQDIIHQTIDSCIDFGFLPPMRKH